MEIKVRNDGALKHLGVKSDMDTLHSIQKAECKETIDELGKTITGAISRSRDKCTAIGYCVRTNVGYRAQHCSWSLKEFEEVDSTFLSLVKKATLNMNSFPGRLLTSRKKDGGLGIISISDAAHERKRKVLLQLVNKGGADGIAIQGLLGRAMRTAGHGGQGSSGNHVWESLDDSGCLNSLIVKLRSLGLRLRAGGSIEGREEFAAKDENMTEERERLNRRGIVLESEMVAGGASSLRI